MHVLRGEAAPPPLALRLVKPADFASSAIAAITVELADGGELVFDVCHQHRVLPHLRAVLHLISKRSAIDTLAPLKAAC